MNKLLCAFALASSVLVACAPDAGSEPTISHPASTDSSSAPPSSSSSSTSSSPSNSESPSGPVTGGAIGNKPAPANTGAPTTPTTPTITTSPTTPTPPPPAFVCNSATDSVTASYKIALLRAPDTAGLQFWVEQVQAGAESRLDVLANIVRSPEFANLHADLTDTQYVTSLYAGLLGRQPDTAGLDNWVNELATGTSRTDVALGFVDSTEFADPTLNPAYACYF